VFASSAANRAESAAGSRTAAKVMTNIFTTG
jgi:hypothetical protein